MALTHKQIESFSRNPVEKQVPDGTPNLYLHVRASGSLNWLCRVSVEGKRVPLTIGTWPQVTGPSARAITPALVRLVADGHGIQAIRNAMKVSLDPDVLSTLVRGEQVATDRATPSFEVVAREPGQLERA